MVQPPSTGGLPPTIVGGPTPLGAPADTSTSPPASSPIAPLAPGGVPVAEAVATAPIDASGIPSSFPLGAIGSVSTPQRAGAVFRLDGGFLDGLRMQLRRIKTKEGVSGYELQLKVSGPSRADFAKRMEQKGATTVAYEFYGATPVEEGGQVVLARDGTTQALGTSFYSHKDPETSTTPNLAWRLEGSGWTLDYFPPDGPLALRGQVRLQLTGADADCDKAMKQAIDAVGLQSAFAPATAQAARRLALMRLLWQQDPAAAKALADKPLTDLKLDKIEQALTDKGVGPERIAGLGYEEVAPGHFTVVDPQQVEDMKAAGLRYAYSTVTLPEHVLSILQEGQKATLSRWSDGQIVTGMSSMADVGSGGAQGVFSRLVTQAANGKSWAGRTYKIVLRPELLGRTDIWGWPGDYYGRAWQLTDRNFGTKLLEDIGKNGGYAQYNEIISPVGNGTQYIACVVATNAADRTKLIDHLKAAGWTPPGGQSLEDFVRLAPSLDAGLLG